MTKIPPGNDLHVVWAGCVAMSYFMFSFVLHKGPVTGAGKTFHPNFQDGETTTHYFPPAGYSHLLPTLVLWELFLSQGF